MQCSQIQCSAVQCSTLQCNVKKFGAIHCIAVQCSAIKQHISAVHFYGVLKASVNTSPPWGAGGHCVQTVLCPLYFVYDTKYSTVLYK